MYHLTWLMASANAVGESSDMSACAQTGMEDIGPSGPYPSCSSVTRKKNKEKTIVDNDASPPATCVEQYKSSWSL